MRNRPGTGGLGLLQDTQLIETLAHFNRERIPERYEPVYLLYNIDLKLIGVVALFMQRPLGR